VTTFSAGTSRLWPTAASLTAEVAPAFAGEGLVVGSGVSLDSPRRSAGRRRGDWFSDGEDEVEQLGTCSDDRERHRAGPCLFAAREGADRRVVADGGPSGVPQVAAHPIVVLCGTLVIVPGARGCPVCRTPERFSSGKTPKIVDQVVGRREPVDVHDLGDQSGGRGRADAGMVTTWT